MIILSTVIINVTGQNSVLLRNEWLNFIKYGKKINNAEKNIQESWQRCKEYGINFSCAKCYKSLSTAELVEKLNCYSDLINIVKIYTNKIYHFIKGKGYLIFLTDNVGNLLYLSGDKLVLKDFEDTVNFRVGVLWNERTVGTTAVSMVLDTKNHIPFVSEEKFCLELKKRACTAVPIKDAKNNLIGTLGIASNRPFGDNNIFRMLVIAETAIENHLNLSKTTEESNILTNYFDTVFDSISDGILSIDNKGRLVNMNKAAENILLIQAKNAIGINVNELFNIDLNTIDKINSRTKEKEFVVKTTYKGITRNIKNSIHIIKKDKCVEGFIDIISEDEKNNFTKSNNYITFEKIVGESKKIMEVKKQAEIAAKSNANILITGKSGTGKELFAKAIHNSSLRCNKPFIAINCGALPKELIESELFGYEEGAFTGARRGGKPGKFEMASGGTVFLDEIGEMPLNLQVRLLRVIQEREIVRIGGFKPVSIDIRLISASNKELAKEMDKGNFREDLFWRLNVIDITIPELYQRKDDIPLLVDYFIKKHSSNKDKLILTEQALKILKEYSWPGNVRELENTIQRAVIFSANNKILPSNLPDYIYKDINNVPSSYKLEDNEKNTIIKCLKKNSGNILRTAKELGISRNTLYLKINKYSINNAKI